jgi:hypothetical protein
MVDLKDGEKSVTVGAKGDGQPSKKSMVLEPTVIFLTTINVQWKIYYTSRDASMGLCCSG